MTTVGLKEVITLAKNISSCALQRDWEQAIDYALRTIGAQYYLVTVGAYEPVKDFPDYVLSTFPCDWMDHYRSAMLIRKDPIRRYSHAHSLPMAWAKLKNNDDAEFWKSRNSFGLREGVTLPIKGLGRVGTVNIALDGASCPDERVAILNVLTPHIAEKVLAHNEASTTFERSLLSPREMEVLQWLAEGKRSPEIAIILDCTERTVNFHVTNIVRKLNASGRQHAVAKAVNTGLVSPSF